MPEEQLAKLMSRKIDKTLSDSPMMKVGEHIDRWLAGPAKRRAAPTTLNRYEGIATKHIKP